MAKKKSTKQEQPEQDVIQEAGLTGNWQVLDINAVNPAEPRPGATPPLSNEMPPHFLGTLNPDMQHDKVFVGTQVGSPRVASTPLMPVAPSGNPQTNAAIRSLININKTTTTTTSSSGMNFRGVWNSFTPYNINDVVLFNTSAYVAATGSLNSQPDLNVANWTLLSENFVFNATAPNNQQAGVGPMIGSVLTFHGAAGPLSAAGTPSTQFPTMIAIVQTQVDNSSSLASIPVGWNLLIDPGTGNVFPASGSSNSFYYKVFTGGSVGFTSNLNSDGPWQATLAFFQFGGFAQFPITHVSITGTTATFTCNNTLTAGNLINFSGLSGASFLNGLISQVLSTGLSSTQFQAAVPNGHNGYNAGDNGTATQTILQYSGWSSGAGGSVGVSLTGTQKNSIFVAQEVAGGNSYSGAVFVSGTDSNTPPNTYTIGNASGGPSISGSTSGIAAVAYSSPNDIAGNVSITITASGSFLDASGIGGFELPGGANVVVPFKPFNVIEFRGSIFVCLAETSGTPFTTPAAWGIIGPATGFTQSKTSSYSTVQSDEGNLLSFNSASAVTLTLLNPLPIVNGLIDSGWGILVQNLGTGLLTISPNGLLIDGLSTSITLGTNQGTAIFTDGFNYFTWHGVNRVSVPSWLVATGPDGSGNVAITSAIIPANQVLASPNGSSGPLSPRALVSADVPAPGMLALAEVQGTLQTGTVTGVIRLPGNVIPPKGVYRVAGYMMLAANPAAGTLDMQIGWTEGFTGLARTASNGQDGTPADISTAATNFSSGTLEIVSDGIHDITFTMTLT